MCTEENIGVEINNQIYLALELLGADSTLLSYVGSRHDTLPDDVVLAGIRAWVKDKERIKFASFP